MSCMQLDNILLTALPPISSYQSRYSDICARKASFATQNRQTFMDALSSIKTTHQASLKSSAASMTPRSPLADDTSGGPTPHCGHNPSCRGDHSCPGGGTHISSGTRMNSNGSTASDSTRVAGGSRMNSNGSQVTSDSIRVSSTTTRVNSGARAISPASTRASSTASTRANSIVTVAENGLSPPLAANVERLQRRSRTLSTRSDSCSSSHHSMDKDGPVWEEHKTPAYLAAEEGTPLVYINRND